MATFPPFSQEGRQKKGMAEQGPARREDLVTEQDGRTVIRVPGCLQPGNLSVQPGPGEAVLV